MLKILLLLAVIFVGYLAVRTYRRAIARSAERVREADAPIENMVRCARCGVNLPKSDALCENGVCVCAPGQPCDRAP